MVIGTGTGAGTDNRSRFKFEARNYTRDRGVK
jgi:hypothetical protein